MFSLQYIFLSLISLTYHGPCLIFHIPPVEWGLESIFFLSWTNLYFLHDLLKGPSTKRNAYRGLLNFNMALFYLFWMKHTLNINLLGLSVLFSTSLGFLFPLNFFFLSFQVTDSSCCREQIINHQFLLSK